MALLPITINGQLIKQPTTLKEYKEQSQTEQYAIDNGVQRNRVFTPGNPTGAKAWAEMMWDKILPADYQQLYTFFSTGSGVYYSNPSSGKFGTLTFSGLPFIEDPDPYVAGESMLSTFKVRIREL